jgi:nicotinate-nucleotide adenylyltransferase
VGRRRMGFAVSDPLSPTDRRVGILGGTFDPIHYGHLVIAEEVREALGLDRVLFVPAAIPPHKVGLAITSAEDRAEMVRLAIEDNPAFSFSRIELDREGPSYTADTLSQLTGEARAQAVEREFFFILSTEALAGLPDWHEPDRILALARVAVVARPGTPMPDERSLERAFGRRANRIVHVQTVPLAHSASAVRVLAAAGKSIRYLVPVAVETYICEHGLYRSHHLSEERPK